MANFTILVQFNETPTLKEFERLQALMAEHGFRLVSEVTTKTSTRRKTVYDGTYKSANSDALQNTIKAAIQKHIKKELRIVFAVQITPPVIPSPKYLF